MASFEAYILLAAGYDNLNYGLTFNENRIKMTFAHYESNLRFPTAPDCKSIHKSASCISTVVAHYIIHRGANTEATRFMKAPLLALLRGRLTQLQSTYMVDSELTLIVQSFIST